jgi:hypothetical protein
MERGVTLPNREHKKYTAYKTFFFEVSEVYILM